MDTLQINSQPIPSELPDIEWFHDSKLVRSSARLLISELSPIKFLIVVSIELLNSWIIK